MAKRPNALLVGAGGFIGTSIRETLLSGGWNVTGISRTGTTTSSPGYTAVTADATSIDQCIIWIDAADAVVYNAAYIPTVHSALAEAEPCLRVNALAPLAFLERMASRPRPFVYVSGGQGYRVEGRLAREDDLFLPTGHAAFYLSSKLLGEIYTEHYRTVHALPSAVLRVGSVYGPGQIRGMIAQFVRRARAGETIVLQDGGEFRSDLTFVDDAGQAVLAVLNRHATGVYNIGSGESTSALDAAKLVMLAAGGEATRLSIEPRTTPIKSVGFCALDVTRARNELDYRPTSVNDGIARTVCEWKS